MGSLRSFESSPAYREPHVLSVWPPKLPDEHNNPIGLPRWPIVLNNADGTVTVVGRAQNPDVLHLRELKLFGLFFLILWGTASAVVVAWLTDSSNEPPLEMAGLCAVAALFIAAPAGFTATALGKIVSRGLLRKSKHSWLQVVIADSCVWFHYAKAKTSRFDLDPKVESIFRALPHPSRRLITPEKSPVSKTLFWDAAVMEFLRGDESVYVFAFRVERHAQNFVAACNAALHHIKQTRQEQAPALPSGLQRLE